MYNVVKAGVICLLIGMVAGALIGYPCMAFVGSKEGPSFNPGAWDLQVRYIFSVIVIGGGIAVLIGLYTITLEKLEREKYKWPMLPDYDDMPPPVRGKSKGSINTGSPRHRVAPPPPPGLESDPEPSWGLDDE